MLTSLLLLLSPFIQLGVSYYGSVATLMAILCVILWRQPLLLSLGNWRTHAKFFIVLGMTLSLASSASSQSLQDVLRIAREGLLFVLMTTLIERFSRTRGGILAPLVLRTAFVMSFCFLVLAVAQTYALHHKIYLGIPKRFFVQNDNTIPDQLDLIFSPLRPNGTFGEPSYFAFVIISMFVMFLPLARHLRSVRIMLIGLTLAGVLSQSLSFLIALPLIVFFGYVRTATVSERIRIVGFAAVLLALYFVSHETVAARLHNGIFGRDISTYQRIIAPLSVLWDFLTRHPVGVPFASLPSVLQPFASRWGLLGADILMNGVLNALFCYGFIGFAVIGAYLLSARDATLRAYLFVSACFNGALFAVDKFCIICLTVSLYMLCTAMVREQTPLKLRINYRAVTLPGFRKPARQNPIQHPG